MVDVLDFFVKLAQAFFEPFAKAVTEYPLPTAVVFLVSYFIIWPETSKRYDKYFFIAAILQFVLTVFAANVIGWVFDSVLGALKLIFGAAQFSASIFVEHPLEFSIHFTLWYLISIIILLYLASWKIKNTRRYHLGLAILPVLLLTYVSTNIHVHLSSDQPASAELHISWLT